MHELDKRALGRRIRQIRLAVGMRQWELAQRLGTTQSAVHKYERGVIPEPRRLVELARIGETTIEWILTGRHWEHGADSRERLTREVLELARSLHELSGPQRRSVEEALRILEDALRGLESESSEERAALVEHGRDAERLVRSALRIQRSVLRGLAEAMAQRLDPGDAAALD